MRGLYKNVPALVPKTHKMLIYTKQKSGELAPALAMMDLGKRTKVYKQTNHSTARISTKQQGHYCLEASKAPTQTKKSGELVPVLAMMDLGERTKVKKQNKKGLPCSQTVFRCFLFGGGKWDRSSLISGHFSATGGPGKGPGRGPARFAPSFSPVDQF